MILVTVLYPAGAEGSFNRDYYLQTHIPLLREKWTSMGLEDVRLLRRSASGDGKEAPYQVIALLTFARSKTFRKRSRLTAGDLRGHSKVHVGEAGGADQ